MPITLTHTVVAILAALVASYVLGSLWYLVFGKQWRNALGWNADASSRYRPTASELLIALVGQAMLAILIAIAFSVLVVTSLYSALSIGFILWLGVILPTLTTNVVFSRRNKMLVYIDGGHWLLILLTLSAVQYLVR